MSTIRPGQAYQEVDSDDAELVNVEDQDYHEVENNDAKLNFAGLQDNVRLIKKSIVATPNL